MTNLSDRVLGPLMQIAAVCIIALGATAAYVVLMICFYIVSLIQTL